MGSIEIFDSKQMKWVPYVPDYDKWKQHFQDIQNGYVKPDHLGRYIVGSGRKYRPKTEVKVQQPQVKFVTPIAQALEIAKSELQRENSNQRKNNRTKRLKNVRKRKNTETISTKPKYPRTIQNGVSQLDNS